MVIDMSRAGRIALQQLRVQLTVSERTRGRYGGLRLKKVMVSATRQSRKGRRRRVLQFLQVHDTRRDRRWDIVVRRLIHSGEWSARVARLPGRAQITCGGKAMVLVKGSKVTAVPAATFHTTAHAATALGKRRAGHGGRSLLRVWLRTELVWALVLLGGREFVTRMSLEVVALLDAGQKFVLLPGLTRLNLPALTRRFRNLLVVGLSDKLLGALCVGGTVEHEGVHRTSDTTIPLGNFLHTGFDGAVDPVLHVAKGNVCQMLGRFAQGSSDSGLGAFSQLLGSTLDAGSS